jgi:hypothetical protein
MKSDDDVWRVFGTEYDPDAKPPLYRRVRLCAIVACVMLIAIIGCTLGAVLGNSSKSVIKSVPPLPARDVLQCCVKGITNTINNEDPCLKQKSLGLYRIVMNICILEIQPLYLVTQLPTTLLCKSNTVVEATAVGAQTGTVNFCSSAVSYRFGIILYPY